MDPDDAYSVFIVEDEMPARELLVEYLLTRPELTLAGIAKNGRDAIAELSCNSYDLVFMDIHLPQMSGIEILERVAKLPYLIFTTAYGTYALKAFEFHAVDYLLKPFSMERFNQAIDKFLHLKRGADRKAGQSGETGFSFKDQGRHHILPFKDIVYFTSHGKHVVIHSIGRDYETSMMLKDIEHRLPHDLFIRIHKQYIVNIRYISMVEYYIGGQYLAFLKDDDESSLPVGKKYAPLLKERLRLD
jgi:DNA-binding LytR/AlgR family response regulator